MGEVTEKKDATGSGRVLAETLDFKAPQDERKISGSTWSTGARTTHSGSADQGENEQLFRAAELPALGEMLGIHENNLE